MALFSLKGARGPVILSEAKDLLFNPEHEGDPSLRARSARFAQDDRLACSHEEGRGFAPLITSHSMMASSPNRAGWENMNTLFS